MKKQLLIKGLCTLALSACLLSSTLPAFTASASEAVLDTGEQFTERDLLQEADTTDAVSCTLTDGEDIHITEEGVYVLSGTAADVTIYVEAADEDKVQLVLDGVELTNQDYPCIYVKSGDKVFVTTQSDSRLSVTGSFVSDDDSNTDGVIFSFSDLVLNGTAELTLSSSENGVVCKEDLKVSGGSYDITAGSKCLEANDSIRIAGGRFTLNAGTDALHAEYDEDDSVGYIYIEDGSFTIQAGDDGIHATTIVQIEGGSFVISAGEGIEATCIRINDGTFEIEASDDAVNGAQKSSVYRPTLEFNDGNITIVMGAGDTDGIDCNGDLVITGGTIQVTGNSSFDIDGNVSFTGGTVIVNGQQVDTIPNQMAGMMGGFGGQIQGGNESFGGQFQGGNGSFDGQFQGGNGSFGGQHRSGSPSGSRWS